MKKILGGAMALILASTTFAQQTVDGTTNFKVTIPEVLVLYHWDEAHLKLDDYIDNVPDVTPATHEKTSSIDLSTVTIDGANAPAVDTSTVPKGLGGKISVTLKDSWAVRAISSGNVTMAVAVQKGDHILNGTDNSSKAVVSNASLSNSTITPSWSPTSGDLTFDLDLSGVTKPGEHKTAASRTPESNDVNDTFKLTLTGN